MSLPFTSVVSYHTNPMTCGVAKFSAQLAERLGVPFGPLEGGWGAHPLLSLKWAETDSSGLRTYVWDKLHEREREGLTQSVFWHDGGDRTVTDYSTHVFHADPSLGVNGLWCPSLITPRKRPVKLFSFGMAHKLQTDKYRRVRELLDAAEQPYHLRVSVGLHEGTSLDGAEKHFDALKEIMGPEHVTILGILSDDAVSEELSNCDYVLAFFEKGLRANNTTVHAALRFGRKVITNHDNHTPDPFRPTTFNISGMEYWPRPWSHLGWDALIKDMERVCAASPSTAAR